MANFSIYRETYPAIKNILLLDSEGKRIAVKYYSDDWPTSSAKSAFEKSMFTRTQKTNARSEAEIAMFDNNIVVYKFIQDLHFFITGGDDENELILASVLQGFVDAISLLLRNNVDKTEALENLDLILLCLDEIADGGAVLNVSAVVGEILRSLLVPFYLEPNNAINSLYMISFLQLLKPCTKLVFLFALLFSEHQGLPLLSSAILQTHPTDFAITLSESLMVSRGS
ncbi:Coatomer subunit zeta-1 [Sarracenia purpurea var. burkii]